MAESGARVAVRKNLRCRAKVSLGGGRQPMSGRTVDISLSGVSLLLDDALPAGETCVIGFEVPFNGTMRKVIVSAKTVYSVCSGTDGFRVGFQFVQLDAANTSIINAIVG